MNEKVGKESIEKAALNHISSIYDDQDKLK